ncbi:hypothetical protein ZEAMMB73_Zm00001d050674 [Zea mays]|uniref:Uncharacterized protein n=1 Tax=Zea mays TaxID=4577 RepID=A0A1D6Q2V7_MAIZE|nr:hypothetical protein ZEAMMB73_Zm00001d050674 [Zea mays]
MTRLEDEVRHMLSARALDLEIEAPSGLTLLSMASDRSNSNATKAVVGEEDDGSVSSFVGRRSSYRSLQSIREIDLFPADAISDLHTKVRKDHSWKHGGFIIAFTRAWILVVSFNGENQAITKYNMFIRKVYRSSLQEGAINALGLGSVMAILFSSYGLAVWYGSKLIVERGYNGGMVISVIMSVMIGAMSLGQATRSVTAFAEGQGAAHRMFKIIERKPDIDIDDNTGIILEDVKGDVQLKDVYFSYPTRPEHLIFDGFSLQVPSGTTMALVGDSGSGKSTVISLVERFYDPHAGEVLIDGVDI